MTRYIHRRPRADEVPIAPAPAPTPAIQLNLRQQRTLSEVIEAAQRSPGSLSLINRDNWIYTAQHRDGRTRWVIQDVYRKPVADGVCS